MDSHSRLESKIDKLSDRLSSIDATLAAQHESLKNHIRRTELLERRMDPVETHMSRMQGGLKVLASAGLIAALVKLASLLMH